MRGAIGKRESRLAADRAGAQFDRFLNREKADAWMEGHKTRQVRGPDSCHCYAWSEGECGCGRYGTGPLLTKNPYESDDG